jgi:hypothetical protein
MHNSIVTLTSSQLCTTQLKCLCTVSTMTLSPFLFKSTVSFAQQHDAQFYGYTYYFVNFHAFKIITEELKLGRVPFDYR